MSAAEDLRRRVGTKPYSGEMKHNDPDMFNFLKTSQSSLQDFAFQQIARMTDDELMARWARYQLERGDV